MNNLKELEKKYEELGKEIERLKKEQGIVGFKEDPIFLLSKEEYKKYKDKIPKINCWWWLRSPGDESDYVAGISDSAFVYDYGSIVNCSDVAVRPALKISDSIRTKLRKFIPVINANKLQTYHRFGDRIVFNGVTWMKLSDDIYISEMPIDFRRFDASSNNYETSEIRQFLLKWFEERLVLN